MEDLMNEQEALEFCEKLLEQYQKINKTLKEDYNKLIKLKEGFPVQYIENTDFEDLILKASNAKFQAILLARKINGFSSEVQYEVDYLISIFKINIADEALSEKFDKITEGLRDAYVNSKKQLKNIRKLNDSIQVFADSSEKLIRMFDSDEINFRRMAEKKNRMMGFS